MVETFVVYHDDRKYLKMDHITPIRVGCYNKDIKREHGVLYDDIGENISYKNSDYNELTAIYWLWKNYDKIHNPKYIGIQHYRRFYYTSDTKFSYFESEQLNPNLLDYIQIDNNKFKTILGNYDFIIPCPIKVKSVSNQYSQMHNAKDIDDIKKIIVDLYPEYENTANNYLNGNICYLYNMFIFNKEIFFRYCEWIFNILSKFEEEHENSRFFISERLTGIFIAKLIEEGLKPYYMPILYISGEHKSIKEALGESKLYLKNKKGFKYVLKPFVEFILPKKVWIGWKRKLYKKQ